MKLSIVTTLFSSSDHIVEFFERVSKVAKELVRDDYEIIFVNDGSPDNCLNISLELMKSDPKLKVIDLSRNFGHHRAMMCGLENAIGEKIFLIDVDLEEEPEWLISFNSIMISEDVDLVYGVQGERKGGLFEKITGYFFL